MLVSHLMNQQKGKGLFSPAVNTFIIDEAHNIESKFRSAYTTAYSKSDIVHVISESVKNIRNPIMKANAEEIKMELEELFRMFRVQVHKQELESEGDVTSFFLEMNKDISEKLILIRKKLATLNARTEKDAGAILQFLREVSNSADDNLVWLERDKSLRLCVCQKDIRKDISRLLFTQGRCTILTSATISDKQTGTPREKCSYYLYSIGYPVTGMVSEPKKSPFDYEHHTMLYCSKEMPYPSIERRKEYRAASIAEIVKLLEVTNGKALILFTSKEDMEYVYKKLSNMHLPYKILMQSKTSSQAYQLEKFKSDTNSVILGTGTYWEGINVEGESLSQVIVYKLPFPVPEPIIDYKMSLTENPIDEVAVPEMVIQLKQGVGRLIRSANDTGIVSILDPRVRLGKAKYEDTFRRVNAKKEKKALSLCVISEDLQQVRSLAFCKECGHRLFRRGGNTRSEKWDCRNQRCYPLDYRLTDQMLIGAILNVLNSVIANPSLLECSTECIAGVLCKRGLLCQGGQAVCRGTE